MTAAGWIEIALYIAILTAITPLLGGYMTRVYRGEIGIGVVERAIAALGGDREQDWKAYAKSVLISSAVFFGLLYVILRPRMPYDVAFNTTASFVTNTNWQFYAGETTLSNLQQMTGLAVQNFVSAAVGIAVAIAFIRALASRSGTSIGNFYSDLVKTLIYVLLPISVVVGLFLVSQGVIQSLTTGPVASQEVIKELGTNGGGFFNVNSAHPFENPTWLSNFVELLLILAIPAALTSVYVRMVGNRRQGWALYAAMLSLLIVAVVVVAVAENGSTPAMDAAGVTGINMEGKEQRFGIASTALWVVVTTAASCGAVNGAMESLSGIGGMVPMAEMQTGEVIFGGVGSGLYGMLMFAILGVFLSGLMVGRTPEFLGKKIEAREIKLTVFGTIGVPMLVLVTSALAIATTYGQESIYNSGPNGWSETLYAYTSQANNNGSAFAGYGAVTFSSVLGGLAMLGGRFLPLLAVLAIAGSLAGKRVAPAGAGTFRTDSPTFVVVLVGVVLIVALLTFVPALLLGPVVQGLTDQLF
jgi:potassium-transporting ATPase potassium-binding subunit